MVRRNIHTTRAVLAPGDGISGANTRSDCKSQFAAITTASINNDKRHLLFIEVNSPSGFNAGKKAFDDVNSILKQAGFASILVNRNQAALSRVLRTPLLLLQLTVAFLVRRNLVVIQSPIPKEVRGVVKCLLRIARARSVIVLHDIDSMRYSRKARQIGADLRLYNSVDAIIAHNTAMKAWLEMRGVRTPTAPLRLFDYLIDGTVGENGDQSSEGCSPSVAPPNWKHEMVFAGSLSPTKSGFIYKLPDDFPVRIRVFGTVPDPTFRFPAAVEYCGAFPPGSPTLPSGVFGLVWDGPDISTCSGAGGDYLRINSPHKVSLYLASGLPVLCWRESALAEYIESEHLGIAVASLDDVPKRLDALPPHAYLAMLEQVEKTKSRLRAGHYLTDALARTSAEVT